VTAEKCIRPGANDYSSKPVDPDRLVFNVTSLVEKPGVVHCLCGNVQILIVDDRPENLFAVEPVLSGCKEYFRLICGAEALNLILEHDFCVAIVDIQIAGRWMATS